jgi:hypothetical protein
MVTDSTEFGVVDRWRVVAVGTSPECSTET